MNEMTVRLQLVLKSDIFNEQNIENELNVENNRFIGFIDNQNFRHLFRESNSIIASIVSNKSINYYSKTLFVCIKTIENNSLIDESHDSVKLMVSHQFLTHYCLSPEDQSLLLTFMDNCPKLSHVTIGVKDNDLYKSIIDENWSNTLLSSVCESRQSKILCRKCDIFCAINDLIVLNCKPVLQGIISLNTEIIFINISQTFNSQQISDNLLSDQKSSIDSEDKMVNVLNLMSFTTRLLMNPTIGNSFDYNYHNLKTSSITAIKALSASNSFLNSMSFSFKIIILSNSPLISEVDSENGCVFVARNTLINKLKYRQQEWVRIWLSSDDNTLKVKQRFSQIYAIDSISNENIVYISPQLWFNLQTLSTHTFKNQPLLQPNINLMIRKDVLKDEMKYCKCVNISLIHSPNYSANNDFSIVLKNYFNKSRYIVKNDVIGICSRNDPSFHCKSKELSATEWPIVYFKVSLIDGSGCLVDINHSKLYQSGTTHSLIPTTLQSYYTQNDWFSLDTSPVLLGLTSTVNALCDIVMPYLTQKSRVIGTVMINGPSGSGKKSVVRLMCRHWNLNLYEIIANDIIGETLSQTETRIKSSLSKASIYAPTVVLISDINVFSNNEIYDDSRIANTFNQSLFELIEVNNEWPLIIIATNSEPKKFAINELNSLFIHSIEIDCPNVDEREQLLRALLGQIPTSDDIYFSDLAQKSAGFYLGDLKALVSKASEYLFEYFSDSILDSEMRGIALSGALLLNEHLSKALNELQKLHFDAIGSPNIPNVEWDDIGGHQIIKSEILDTIQLPLECPQLISLGFKRSGVLLYGPPGTGKTLLAKAAANECSLNFLSVKGPELINMFVGQSEENVRNLFSRARKSAPAVIFFDELDSLAPNRGRSGDSGGVMDRVVSQLLAEMDGINKANDVFVIGATNRPDLLDSALLRPGRFERLLYVGIADDSKSRLQILKALTRKFQFDSDIDLQQIESSCPPGLSGADFYSICSNALLNAIQRNIQLLDNKSIEEELCQIVVQMSDFISVLPQISKT